MTDRARMSEPRVEVVVQAVRQPPRVAFQSCAGLATPPAAVRLGAGLRAPEGSLPAARPEVSRSDGPDLTGRPSVGPASGAQAPVANRRAPGDEARPERLASGGPGGPTSSRLATGNW
jgi:hypothetical protein